MKNIHLLPTENPSRLYYNIGGALLFKSYENHNGVNIYITSDKEIKEGDWFLWKDTEDPYLFKCIGLTDTDSLQVENSLTKKIGTYNRDPKDSDYGDWYRCYSKKIILTTDQDLIKDGVQSIDDEFLEWFVNNPSCEEVEVNKEWNEERIIDGKDIGDYSYKIIIPQKEPKKYPIGGYAPGYYSCKCVTCKQEFMGDKYAQQCEPCAIEMIESNGGVNNEGYAIEEPKQQTLGKAAKQYKDLKLPDDLYDGFIAGAKWQAERMYSEEEVGEILYNAFGEYGKHYGIMIDGALINKLFEQFKNK
jgi:hypothetical protein